MVCNPSVLNGYVCAHDYTFIKLVTLKSAFWHYFKLECVIRLLSQLWVGYKAMDYLAIDMETHLKSMFNSSTIFNSWNMLKNGSGKNSEQVTSVCRTDM